MLSTLMVSVAPGGVVNAPLRRAAKGVGHSGDGVPSCSQSIRLGISRASGPQRRGTGRRSGVRTSPRRRAHRPPPPAAGSRGPVEVRSATADAYNARQIVCAAFSEKCPLFPNTVPLSLETLKVGLDHVEVVAGGTSARRLANAATSV